MREKVSFLKRLNRTLFFCLECLGYYRIQNVLCFLSRLFGRFRRTPGGLQPQNCRTLGRDDDDDDFDDDDDESE